MRHFIFRVLAISVTCLSLFLASSHWLCADEDAGNSTASHSAFSEASDSHEPLHNDFSECHACHFGCCPVISYIPASFSNWLSVQRISIPFEKVDYSSFYSSLFRPPRA